MRPESLADLESLARQDLESPKRGTILKWSSLTAKQVGFRAALELELRVEIDNQKRRELLSQLQETVAAEHFAQSALNLLLRRRSPT
jgi:hypothetical protein